MFKSSISVSQYSIARCLNFCSQKQETESFVSLVYAMKEMNWWPCNCLKSIIYLSKHYKIYYRLHNIYLQTNLLHPRKYLRQVMAWYPHNCCHIQQHHPEVIYLKTKIVDRDVIIIPSKGVGKMYPVHKNWYNLKLNKYNKVTSNISVKIILYMPQSYPVETS